MFLAWMECNEHICLEIDGSLLEAKRKRISISRIHNVSPNLGEAYFLRILSKKVKGLKCFVDIHTVHGHVCATFREACYALGFLDRTLSGKKLGNTYLMEFSTINN
uniref:Uncharacterized protein n=1 Tax=Lactuca sativa TaxID=4236 RepID=A0A9R1ULR3_LACSA|nr:hypothetical protein LSAT_V11C800443660 [Lactuca sativa]